jgi:hypothetical protein
MNRSDFLYLLLGTSYASFKFAKRYLSNDLVPEFRYDIQLNLSNDDPNLTQFDTYPEDNGKKYFNLEDKEVVAILCRNNKVPVWIDISVSKSENEKTTLRLLCAGRYTSDNNELYYNERGSGPFGIKSPNLPYGYKEGIKFKL